MNESKITTRYAKAIFKLAKEKNLLDQIKNDFQLVEQVLSIPEFKKTLFSPIIAESAKKQIIKEVFDKKINQYTLNFLLLTIDTQREIYLELIIKDYFKLYREELGIKEAKLTTAVEISEKQKQEIINILAKVLESKIELIHEIDEKIIGGFILRVEDKLLDMSIASQLQKIKNKLID